MKKLVLLSFMTIFIGQLSFGQKMYVWCQKEQVVPQRKGFLADLKIDLVVFDARTLTASSKIECESDVITSNIAQLIKQTYPSATINILSSDEYYQKAKDGIITIKVSISAYHAAFGANVTVGIGSVGGNFSWGAIPEGKWNAVTGYNVNIYDNRTEDKKKGNHSIGKLASRPNTGGYRTAKNILNSTYLEANQELFSFIDNCFME